MCLEHGVDAGGRKQNSKLCLFVCMCGVTFPSLSSPNCRIAAMAAGKQTQRSSRSNVYQPTEMAVVLNRGTVSIKKMMFWQEALEWSVLGGSFGDRDTPLCGGCSRGCKRAAHVNTPLQLGCMQCSMSLSPPPTFSMHETLPCG